MTATTVTGAVESFACRHLGRHHTTSLQALPEALSQTQSSCGWVWSRPRGLAGPSSDMTKQIRRVGATIGAPGACCGTPQRSCGSVPFRRCDSRSTRTGGHRRAPAVSEAWPEHDGSFDSAAHSKDPATICPCSCGSKLPARSIGIAPWARLDSRFESESVRVAHLPSQWRWRGSTPRRVWAARRRRCASEGELPLPQLELTPHPPISRPFTRPTELSQVPSDSIGRPPMRADATADLTGHAGATVGTVGTIAASQPPASASSPHRSRSSPTNCVVAFAVVSCGCGLTAARDRRSRQPLGRATRGRDFGRLSGGTRRADF